jgi:aspartate 1-decarboxylase
VFREMLESNARRDVVTQAGLHCAGSVTIGKKLLNAASILPSEKVDIVDTDNGARPTTCAIGGERDSGIIGIDGAAARLISLGDLAIVGHASVPEGKARQSKPGAVLVDRNSRQILRREDPAETPLEAGLRRGDMAAAGGSVR